MSDQYESNPYKFRISSTEDSAIIFVHGFGGDPAHSWSRLFTHMQGVTSWDILSFGYTTGISTFGLELLRRQPSLATVATSLATALRTNPKRYRRLAFITHGEGGLVFQRAYLDHPALRRLVTHAALIASPNTGQISVLNVFGFANRQIREARRNSAFIKALRADWDAQVGPEVPFLLRVVAAEQDNVVPADVAQAGFAPHYHDSVRGDHFSVIRPSSSDARVCRLIEDLLQMRPRGSGTRVFLSYAREDQSIVEGVYARLQQAGVDAWMDVYHLQLGREWEAAIEAALSESRSVLVFISQAAVQAVATGSFLQTEMRRTLDLALSQGRQLIPVQLDETPIPAWVSRFQGLRLRNDDDMIALLNAMKQQSQPPESVDNSL